MKCPICGSKLEEQPCFLFDAASAEIIEAKEYVCKKIPKISNQKRKERRNKWALC